MSGFGGNSESDHRVSQTVLAFVERRLTDRSTIEWALTLGERDRAQRLAVSFALQRRVGRGLPEPWRTAWRLIEEAWLGLGRSASGSHVRHWVAERLADGERTGALIGEIVSLVNPTIKVSPLTRTPPFSDRSPKIPKSFEHLLHARVVSPEVVNPNDLGLDRVDDAPFLEEIARELDACVYRALGMARRLGWKGGSLWPLGDLRRARYIQEGDLPDGEHEPDEFHTGIAPATKLLHAVVVRLSQVSLTSAQTLVQQWRVADDDVHVRLWASIACDLGIVDAQDVGSFLLNVSDKRFWDLHGSPEIAELRARRYAELSPSHQTNVIARLRRMPPAAMWGRRLTKAQVAEARKFSSMRELRRIELGGGSLPAAAVAALRAHGPDLDEMRRLDDGFLGTTKVLSVPSNPDRAYDDLQGEVRLAALQAALSAKRNGWDDDPAGRASDWMSEPGKAALLIDDFESTGNGGTNFPGVWDRFGWAHAPLRQGTEEMSVNAAQGLRVLDQLELLSEACLRSSIEGIAHWLDRWAALVCSHEKFPDVWHAVWPVAVEATNAQGSNDEEITLEIVVKGSDDEPKDLDTLNTPAGKLIGAFLTWCGHVGIRPPFSHAGLATMRETVLTALGRSGLIALHRMIEFLPWFLRVDRDWALTSLVAPLKERSAQALFLWRAAARRTHFHDVLAVIGDEMAVRTLDMTLGRRSRKSLAFSLVVESLHAFREGRAAAVPASTIQQMLRSADDEVRSHAANALQRFVRDLSSARSGESVVDSAEQLFRVAAGRFLNEVWPPERSLATPGVARAFADLPATSGEEFAHAVTAIERFLVPFECWSMIDFGLYGTGESGPKLAHIDNQQKADALLLLLSRCIGDEGSAVVPTDLGDALEQIRTVAPKLIDRPSYRKLAMLIRR